MEAGFVTVLKGVGAAALLYALSYVLGDLAARRSRRRVDGSEKLVNGLVWLLALFALCSFPFYALRYRVSFTPLVWIFSLLMAGAVLLWLCQCRQGGRHPERKKRELDFLQDIWFWICIILLAEHMLTVLRGYEQCSDDQFYISISNIAFEQDHISTALSAWGGFGPIQMTSAPFSGWELFVAWLARLFHLRPVYLYRSFLPLLTMPMCCLSAYAAGKRIFGEKKRARMFVAVYTVLLLFSRGAEEVSHGTFLFWMGKSLIYYFLLPRLLCLCLDIVREQDGRDTWVNAAAALLSGAAMSTIGQYTGVIYVFCLGLPYLLRLAVHKGNGKRLGQCVRRAVLCVLPMLAILLFTFVSQYELLIVRPAGAEAAEQSEQIVTEQSAKTGEERDELAVMPESGDTAPDEDGGEESSLASAREMAMTANVPVDVPGALGRWLTGLRDRRCSDGVFFILGLISMLSLALLPRDRSVRLVLGWSGVTLLCTFLNPLLADVVARYITSGGVYWRLWLLMCLDMTTAAAAVFAVHALAERLRGEEMDEKCLPALPDEEEPEDELARLERELAQAGARRGMSRDSLATLLGVGCMVLTVALSLVLGPGYRYAGLSTTDNLEHALPACSDVVEYIIEKDGDDEFSLLADRIEFRSMPRQYSSHIQVYIGRWGDFRNTALPLGKILFLELEEEVYGKKTLGGVAELYLDELGPEYILSETPLDTQGSDYRLESEFSYDYVELWLYERVTENK